MDTIKTGWKTSEFWVTVVSAVVMVLNQGLGVNLPVEQITAFAGVVIAYVLGRSIVKT